MTRGDFGYLGFLLVFAVLLVGGIIYGARLSAKSGTDQCRTMGMSYYSHAYGGFCMDSGGALYAPPGTEGVR